MVQRITYFILLFLSPFGMVRSEDWSQWRGPERTGVCKEKGLMSSWPPGGPKLVWIFREAGAGHSSVSVVGDRLYSMGAEGNKEYVYAIDLNTLNKLWSVKIGAPYINAWVNGPTSTPTIDGRFVYALGGHGNLVCLEADSGKKVWSQNLVTDLGGAQPSDSYSESPLVDKSYVVVTPGGKEGTIAALNKKTGKVKWRSPAFAGNAQTNASMIVIKVGGIRQYVQMTWSYLAGVRASDGKLLWKYRVGVGLSAPIFHDSCVYAPVGYYGGGCRLLKLLRKRKAFETELIYNTEEMQNHHGGVVLVGDHLYGYSNGAGWICQEFKTGKRVWEKDPEMGQGSITYADGNLYCYHEDQGDVLLIRAKPNGYQEQGRFRIPEETKLPRGGGKIWSTPVIAHGKLYLRDNDLIFCYDIRKSQ